MPTPNFTIEEPACASGDSSCITVRGPNIMTSDASRVCVRVPFSGRPRNKIVSFRIHWLRWSAWPVEWISYTDGSDLMHGHDVPLGSIWRRWLSAMYRWHSLPRVLRAGEMRFVEPLPNMSKMRGNQRRWADIPTGRVRREQVPRRSGSGG